ncbi:MAG: aminopeptidase [bacterium]|nr:aminopeptidase [bacterium]
MQPSKPMIQAALSGMTHVLDLTPEDSVLVVTDQMTAQCGAAFTEAARNFGCDVFQYQLPEDHRPLQKMPDQMHSLLEGKTIVINAIVGDAREVPFRLEWIYKVEASEVIRMGHSPGINPDMMTAGPLSVDYARMQEMAGQVQAGFSGGTSVHITTDLGTDLVLDLKGRSMISDLKAKPGVGANLPCGEVYCCPVENGASGFLVIDGCFGSHGIVNNPVQFTLQAGQVTDISGGDKETVSLITQLMDTDEGSRTIAELGIGLNSEARMSDNMLEAEKSLNTAHIAFGTNQGMPGGCNTSSIHIDYLFQRPSMTVSRANGPDIKVMRNGAILHSN